MKPHTSEIRPNVLKTLRSRAWHYPAMPGLCFLIHTGWMIQNKTIGSDYENSVYMGFLFISLGIRYILWRP